MSGNGVHGLAPVAWSEELDFGYGEARVVPPKAPAAAPGAFTDRVVAPHGVTFPQRVLVRQLAFLQRLD